MIVSIYLGWVYLFFIYFFLFFFLGGGGVKILNFNTLGVFSKNDLFGGGDFFKYFLGSLIILTIFMDYFFNQLLLFVFCDEITQTHANTIIKHDGQRK